MLCIVFIINYLVKLINVIYKPTNYLLTLILQAFDQILFLCKCVIRQNYDLALNCLVNVLN